ncbi:hypothetical protein BSK66_26590 [Paenibacillus odorifer]|uniref:hypothetical protein n=1 Tax=Paenibacillus TaxID=44249 RepID=UPI0003E285EF|nr:MULTISPECIES: hypothetical protein [Paenibacillus]ETT49316.1 hypothetical protein C171_23625 [Paenibacillus sp. FSL H8-237]OME49528.1 hypothetical protein BSK66_26590 [Paenibacillus odorifer]
MSIPAYLTEKDLIIPPSEVVTLCKEYKVNNVFFVDNIKHTNSLRDSEDDDVFINVRGTYWANYIEPPFNAKNLGETILLRLLHEIGHVINQHPAKYVSSSSTGLKIDRENDNWISIFGEIEGEAWSFAFEFRRDKPDRYNNLAKLCEDWVRNHKYSKKDWLLNAEDQYRNIFHVNLSKKIFDIPDWVKEKYPYLF